MNKPQLSFLAKQIFATLLLVFSISAFAVDTDGDGVDDSVDAFPNDACASVDTDHDGMPDSLTIPCGIFSDGFENGFADHAWTSTNWTITTTSPHGGFKAAQQNIYSSPLGVTQNFPAATTLNFYYKVNFSIFAYSPAADLKIDGVIAATFSNTIWSLVRIAIPAGTHTLSWEGSIGGPCHITYCKATLVLDDIYTTNLIEDTDDDNDGVPDTKDYAPLDASIYCASGKYWNGTVCTAASAGYYVPDQHSISQTACAAGTYQPLTGQSSCNTDTVCTLDSTYETLAPTSISDRVCSAVTDCSSLSEYTQTPATLTSDAACAAYTAAFCDTYSPTADACTSCLVGYAFDGSGQCAAIPKFVKDDFDGDSKADVLFLNTSTGGTQYWKSATKSQAIYPGSYDNVNYSYAGSGDFNGDQKADLLFTRASNNGTLIWSGAVKTVATYPGTSAAGFSVEAICDTDGDGKDDVIWYNATTGGTQIWPAANKSAVIYPGSQAAGYNVAACADFDGDGKADLFWRNATTGADEIWNGGSKTNKTYPGANTDLTLTIVGAGDTNGDGLSDLVWYKPSTGAIQIWPGATKSSATYPGTNATTFTPKAIADYDGDGSADLLWSNDTTLGTQIWPAFIKANVIYPGTYTAGFTIQK